MKEVAMHAVIGPVVTRNGGYGFDLWMPEEGLSRSFCYRRVEDAYYARKVEIRSHSKSLAGSIMACATLDQFASTLGEQEIRLTHWPLSSRPDAGPYTRTALAAKGATAAT
jgi:hypothetical protein